MEIFIHRRGKDAELLEVEPTSTAAQIVEALGSPDASMWLEGKDDELDRSARLADVGVSDRSTVHVGTCKKVTVSVRFNMETKTYHVSPAPTLQSIYDRATSAGKGFGFGEVDRTQYTLQIEGTKEQPDLSRHVGAFANDDCEAAFDLVLQDRFQG